MKTTARAILATEQGQATIRGFIANVRESAGPKAHMESELAAQLIEAQDRIVELEEQLEVWAMLNKHLSGQSMEIRDLRKAIEAAPCPASGCCREHQAQTRDGVKWVRCWKAKALGE